MNSIPPFLCLHPQEVQQLKDYYHSLLKGCRLLYLREANEILNEVFEKAIKMEEEGKSIESPKNWSKTVGKNIIFQLKRKEKTKQRMFLIHHCTDKKHLRAILPHLVRQLERQGYCVVQMWDATASPLIEIARCLGPVQGHARADERGIVEVSTRARGGQSSIDRSQYVGLSDRQHLLHTDGAFLSGFFQDGNRFERVGPPLMTLLQCVRPAVRGGTSTVVDLQRVLVDLLTRDPEIAQILSQPGCVSFCRDEQMAVDVAVFEPWFSGRWRVRFRGDEALYTTQRSYEAVQHLYDRYLSNPQYRQRIDLKAGQILILDNFRALHGRESFEDSSHPQQKRFLRRVWIGDRARALMNFARSTKPCRAFERYQPYRVIARPDSVPAPSLELGIRLPPPLQAVVDERMFRPAV